MPKKAKVSSEMLQLAKEAVQKAKTSEDLRMAQAVLVPGLLNVSDHITGQIVGRSRVTVVRLRKKFGTFKSKERNWGGRRSGYLTVEQERQFLSAFLEEASHGGVLVVSVIRKAFEKRVGHKVAKTTVYRMLDRHDWRAIVPRPRHPNANPEAQRAFKKTPENSG